MRWDIYWDMITFGVLAQESLHRLCYNRRKELETASPTRNLQMSTGSRPMIYLLVPTGGAEWTDLRMFTSYTCVEQIVKQGIQQRYIQRRHIDWCFVIAYEGTDELRPVFEFHITSTGDIVRTSPSL